MDKEDVLDKLNSYGLRVCYISGNQAYIECPFHVDRKPSLAVSLDGRGWYCFSCEDGGSLWYLKSRMDRNDIIFPDKSVILDEIEVKTIAHMAVEDYYKLPAARRCNYLIDRGFTDKTIEYWGIRRSDLFIVIPIKDKKGLVKGLILRAMLSTMSPRYQYTTGLDKNNNLFTDFPSLGRGVLVVVEGALDCIMTWQNGFKNVVSILGSSISDNQVDILRDVSHDIFLLLDNDERGKLSTAKIAQRLIGDFNVYIPDYSVYASKDPGDMEPAELRRIFEDKIDYLRARNLGII